MNFSMFEDINDENENAVSNNMSRFPENTPLAMAYVPLQQWNTTFSENAGFEKGTMFPELYYPFAPEEGCL